VSVQLTDVRKVYGTGPGAVEALGGVTYGFEAGTFTAVMGPSGSGKSTLLHCAAGLDVPTSGDVSLVGRSLRGLDETALTELRRGHPLYVAVSNTYGSQPWTAFMDAQNDAQMLGVSGGGRLYFMPPASFARQVSTGPSLTPARVTVDAGWLVAELASPAPVRAVVLRTRGHVVWLQQTVRVDTSLDGATWTVAAEEPSGGLAFVGVLADPRSVPVRVFVPDVLARFVRINGGPFGVGAMTVFGP